MFAHLPLVCGLHLQSLLQPLPVLCAVVSSLFWAPEDALSYCPVVLLLVALPIKVISVTSPVKPSVFLATQASALLAAFFISS